MSRFAIVIDGTAALPEDLAQAHEIRSAVGPAMRGVARALADDGALLLRTSTGDQRILAGEVSLLT